MLVLWPVADQEQDPRRAQVVDEAVEKRLAFGVDPVEILEDNDHGMDTALLKQQQPYRLQSAPTSLIGVEPVPTGIVHRNVEDPEARRHERVEGNPERCQLAGDLFTRFERRLVLGHLEVSAEELDHWQVRRLSVRDAPGVHDEAVARTTRAHKLRVEP